jgi:PKD repeat protein
VAVNEGSGVTLNGSFSDAGSLDTHSLLWQVVASNGQVVADGTGSSFSFTPVDNGTYTVKLTVTDDDGGSHTDTVVVTANNVAPTVLVAGDASGVRGQSRSFTGGFTDPGMLDTHQVRWDFGDGSSTGWQNVTNPNISTSHVWTATGTYNVTMHIRDKDGAVSSDSHTVAIKVFELQQYPGGGFGLVVGGTTGDDVIEFSKASQQRLALYVNNTYHGTFNHSGRLVAYGLDGNDRISAFGLDNEAVLYGGAGDDSLTGGKGNDTLYGNAGADVFDGAQGTNTIFRDAEDPADKGNGKVQTASAAVVRDTLNTLSSRLRKGSPLRLFRF